MLTTVRYGVDSVLELDLDDDTLVACCDAPRGTPLADPAAALANALADPLDFPPFARAVVPGDKVAIALSAGVPQSQLLVAGVVDALVAAGISAGDITIVRTTTDADDRVGDPRTAIDEQIQADVNLRTHDPGDRDQLSYLAASTDAQPIYMNRAICEADLVVPIGVAHVAGSLGYTGPASGIFPAFADEQTAARFRSPTIIESRGRRKKLRARADEVSWLLGVPFAIEVVPGPGESILHILAGRAESVFDRSEKLCEAAWRYTVPRRASVVVAAVEGDSPRQTWENVARAIAAASHALEEDGAIAVCTNLSAKAGPGVQRLCKAEDLDDVLREIKKERPADALVAAELAHAVQRGPVYLLSQLDESLVEDLGLANVADAAEVARLVARHDSCIVLANAQHAIAVPETEEEV